MSESATAAQSPRQSESESPGTPAARTGGSALQTSRGQTTIADSVVAKIATLAAREVGGVASIGGGAASALGGVVGRVRGQEHSTAGVTVEVGERQAAVDITLRVEYPAPIQRVTDAVRDHVVDRVESMTGLEVVEVNIDVVDLAFPGEEQDSDQPPPEPPRSRVQ